MSEKTILVVNDDGIESAVVYRCGHIITNENQQICPSMSKSHS